VPGEAGVVRELHDLVADLRGRLTSVRLEEAKVPPYNALTEALTRTADAAERLLALRQPSASPQPDSVATGGQFRQIILVIERDPILRRLHRTILENNGCQALLAESGEQGLEIYRQAAEQIHWVILDTAIPRWTPVRLVSELRAIRADVRILLTSALDPVAEAAELPAPVAGLLAKPFRAEQLLALLNGP
jgi:CheY-like chemotaxis protein